MKLYYSPGSCSLAPHIMLHELGGKFQHERVDLATKKTASGADYWKVNAKGYVPALEIKKGETLTEVAIILQYLAEKAKATRMLPKSGIARYRALEPLNFVATELHKNIGALFNRNFNDEARKVLREQRIAPRLKFLDDMLGKQKFISGKSFGLADPYGFVVLSWCGHVGVDLAAYPNISRFMGEMSKRKSVVAAMTDQGLIK